MKKNKKQSEVKCGSVNLTKRVSAFLLGAAVALCLTAANLTAAEAQVNLGTAESFAVLSAAPDAGGAVTLTNATVIGDVGSSGPMASVVQTDSTISGAVIAPVSAQVLTDFNSAYDQYATIPCTGWLDTAYKGATLTLTPGVYCNVAAVTFTNTTLTLKGPKNGIWIFKIGTSGTGALTGTSFSVVMANGGQARNVYWQVAEAVTMTDSKFKGTILAGAAITMTRGTFVGQALAKAAVTLTGVAVSMP